jgi:formylglycine-generating enzyme required for sulfatase activity
MVYDFDLRIDNISFYVIVNDDKDCKSKAHALRGGSWDSNASRLRSANRSYNTPGTYGNTAITGFRVVKLAKSLK